MEVTRQVPKQSPEQSSKQSPRQSSNALAGGSVNNLTRPVISAQFICDELLAFMKFYKTNLGELAESYGMTLIQLFALFALERANLEANASNKFKGGTMGGLAQALHCDASNATGIVDRLAALQLITRQENPVDRRVKTLQLTTRGQEILAAINADLPNKMRCDLLSPTELLRLHNLLSKLNPTLTNNKE